ncbi:histidinol dehydrogenase [Exiguobacterium antarcticum]|uniref:Histidinol dehydrogenase n=1 Tax=Exiguobacterium antarcticum TaxID=132920 RepID=A0ABT6QXV7_9BACL|nr:histidinol dehydrogenase [Exiguobacterium antarcticum]AFS71309.1 Histidinol dehydrogenase [Exiguobacterium antarcticum B7]MDI3233520.1 histidinol dehydrogenase [Exiguobacterium antarcticum]
MATTKNFSVDRETEQAVRSILEQVANDGDAAVRRYTSEFDRVDLTDFRLDETKIQEAFDQADPNLVDSLKLMATRLAEWHEQELPSDIELIEADVTRRQRFVPVDSVGIYVPGGAASYPSTVLMNAIPAKAAGVERVVMVTPVTGLSAEVLVAAKIAGVTEIYTIGGAQAVAALTFGTESIQAVDLIVGPGNRFVAEAKRQVYGIVGIDSVAGPSEVVVIADETAHPDRIAADLLAQAEHDRDAVAIAFVPTEAMKRDVDEELERRLSVLPRQEIARRAMENGGVFVASLDEAIAEANRLAAEHLELAVANPQEVVKLIRHAGMIFLGHETPETLGDYVAGTNHVLPTSGTARFASGLSARTFLRHQTMLEATREGVARLANAAKTVARVEGLEAHAQAIEVREN